MINFDDVTWETREEHNPNWTQFADHRHRILIIGGSVSRKANTLLNLINYETDIDKIHLYTKGP